MAETAKELAFVLFDQGKRPSDPEVKALKLKRRTTYNYYQAWKKAHPGSESSTIDADGTTLGSKGSTLDKPSGTTPSKAGTPTAPIIVGKITITPENWGFTQYGAILVLDTYNKAKRDINYGGTIGDFLCDICEFYRRILNYTEVEYGRSTSEGGGGIKKDGDQSLEPTLGLTQG